jgi:hypothetical protein
MHYSWCLLCTFVYLLLTTSRMCHKAGFQGEVRMSKQRERAILYIMAVT